MGTIYVDTGGSATNSGSTDQNAANLSGAAATDVTTVLTLDGSPDLSGIVTSGATQSTIYLAAATVANRKIFWITAADDVLKTVTVDTAPALTAGTSAWAIGGRFVWTPASIEGSLRAGDVVTLNNSPASTTADWITCRTAGDATSGRITVKGMAGSRPAITNTSTTQCVEGGSQARWKFENLEFIQQGASGSVTQSMGQGVLMYNIKVSDGGGSGINQGDDFYLIASEITGVGGDGYVLSGTGGLHAIGNYIHDCTGDGIEITSNVRSALTHNIIDTCAGRGIYFSNSSTTSLVNTLNGNTVYGCGNSGLEVADADQTMLLVNNIFSENGDAAGEFNVEWAAGTAELLSFHAWNVFYHSGGGGGANLSNLTVNAQVASSEFTTDPAFTDAAGGDFSIGSTSPAKAAGFPGQFL